MNSNIRNKKSSSNAKDLFLEYSRTKDTEIREHLIQKYLYIAEILSKKYTNRGIEYEDIYQVACLGLIYAVDRYNPEKGFEFSSFATPTIIGEIKKYFRDKGWSIRVPRRIQELSKKVNNAKVLLSQKLQKTPTVKDIAEFLNCSEEEILESMEASKVYTPQSLDTPYESESEDKEMSLSSVIGEDDKNMLNLENRDFLLKTIDKLNELEKTIIKDRYINGKTQSQIAKEIGMSQMTISRLEKKIIEKFRNDLKEIYN